MSMTWAHHHSVNFAALDLTHHRSRFFGKGMRTATSLFSESGRFTEWPGPLHWIAFPVEIITKPLIHWIASPLFTENAFFSLKSASSHLLPKNRLQHQTHVHRKWRQGTSTESSVAGSNATFLQESSKRNPKVSRHVWRHDVLCTRCDFLEKNPFKRPLFLQNQTLSDPDFWSRSRDLGRGWAQKISILTVRWFTEWPNLFAELPFLWNSLPKPSFTECLAVIQWKGACLHWCLLLASPSPNSVPMKFAPRHLDLRCRFSATDSNFSESL